MYKLSYTPYIFLNDIYNMRIFDMIKNIFKSSSYSVSAPHEAGGGAEYTCPEYNYKNDMSNKFSRTNLLFTILLEK